MDRFHSFLYLTNNEKMVSYQCFTDVAELEDAIDLGSIVNRRAGSNPVIRTLLSTSKINI